MPTALLVFEFIGTTELLVIALVALIIFGPRKLPEIGRTLGRSIGEFKRASEDFKRTWEYEVELERRQLESRPEPAPPSAPLLDESTQEAEPARESIGLAPRDDEEAEPLTVARTPASHAAPLPDAHEGEREQTIK